MLVKDWNVAYSFGIRYKHLLVNRQSKEETDEDIDHILGVGSSEEDGSEEEEGNVKSGNFDDDDDEDLEDEGDSDEGMGQGGLTGQYLSASGYTNAPQYSPPYPMPSPLSRKGKSKKEKNSGRTFELSPRPQPPYRKKQGQEGYGQSYPYGPPVNIWGRPLPYGGGRDVYAGLGRYNVYGGYGSYGGYGPPPDNDGRYPSQPLCFNGMGQYPPRTYRGQEQSPFQTGRPGFQPQGYPQSFQVAQAEFKQESPELEMRSDGRDGSVKEIDVSMNELGEDSNDAALEAELRATELELKVARLQAKRAALSKQSRVK